MIHPLTSLDSLNHKQLIVDSIRGKTKSASHHNDGRCQRKPARLTVVTLTKRFSWSVLKPMDIRKRVVNRSKVV